jgi:uncharacterized protein DUF3551
MRALVFAGTLVAAMAGMAALATPGQAQQIAWCARDSTSGIGYDCMYYTYAQCRTALSGLRGDCVRNPFASYAYDEDRAPRRRRHHTH